MINVVSKFVCSNLIGVILDSIHLLLSFCRGERATIENAARHVCSHHSTGPWPKGKVGWVPDERILQHCLSCQQHPRRARTAQRGDQYSRTPEPENCQGP